MARVAPRANRGDFRHGLRRMAPHPVHAGGFGRPAKRVLLRGEAILNRKVTGEPWARLRRSALTHRDPTLARGNDGGPCHSAQAGRQDWAGHLPSSVVSRGLTRILGARRHSTIARQQSLGRAPLSARVNRATPLLDVDGVVGPCPPTGLDEPIRLLSRSWAARPSPRSPGQHQAGSRMLLISADRT